MTGLLPAGGCTVSVAIISMAAAAAAAARAHQLNPSVCRKTSPTADDSRCPPMTLFGVENGPSENPNSSTHEAPKEPSIQAPPVPEASRPNVPKAANVPRPASKMLTVRFRRNRFSLLKDGLDEDGTNYFLKRAASSDPFVALPAL